MPREIITIQVGQCGNQIGWRFWDLALREHASRGILFDDAMSSFFLFDEKHQILKARALLIDTEQGVINQLLKSEVGELFDNTQLLNEVSGAGNNWAQGFYDYGTNYKDKILTQVNTVLEQCDSPQCFLIPHSIGGGTGSGLGSYIVNILGENYQDIFKFTLSVFPSKDDDVITSPYNSVLSLNHLINNADCVLPVDNESLIEIVNNVKSQNKKTSKNIFGKKDNNNNNNDKEKGKKPYDEMNSIIAHLLSSLTCSMRFEGTLDVDINDITMNLVPFPRQHFIMSSLSPLYHVLDQKLEPRRTEQIFDDVFNSDFQLIKCDNFNKGIYFATALIARGNLTVSDLMYNIEKKKNKINTVSWNHEGFKIGLCSQPPVNMKYGLLCLSNNTAITDCFKRMSDRFMLLYKHKAHLHHFSNYIPENEQNIFDEAIENLNNLIIDYQTAQFKKVNKINKNLTPVI